MVPVAENVGQIGSSDTAIGNSYGKEMADYRDILRTIGGTNAHIGKIYGKMTPGVGRTQSKLGEETMKRLLMTLVLVLLFTGLANAGVLTGDGQVCPGPCKVVGVLITTDGSNDVTVAFHDGTSNSDAKGLSTITVAAADRLGGFMSPVRWPFKTGLYIDVTTSGSTEITFATE